ncbi:hypothetical protein CLF_105318 [Clonorchis sinensis]|uniref:Uncharacterized protein n=1 Tax=Clonorchis sinensis TaxID=79923 RepID=G7YDD3_CLOSI|nr:hypothetical protein CLF_105318 [Clonorchis sinensis]
MPKCYNVTKRQRTNMQTHCGITHQNDEETRYHREKRAIWEIQSVNCADHYLGQIADGLSTRINEQKNYSSVQYESSGTSAPVPPSTQKRILGLTCEEYGKYGKSKARLVAHRRVHVHESVGTNKIGPSEDRRIAHRNQHNPDMLNRVKNSGVRYFQQKRYPDVVVCNRIGSRSTVSRSIEPTTPPSRPYTTKYRKMQHLLCPMSRGRIYTKFVILHQNGCLEATPLLHVLRCHSSATATNFSLTSHDNYRICQGVWNAVSSSLIHRTVLPSSVVETVANRRICCTFCSPARSRMVLAMLIIIGLQGNLQNFSVARDKPSKMVESTYVDVIHLALPNHCSGVTRNCDKRTIVSDGRTVTVTVSDLCLRTIPSCLAAYDTFMRDTWRSKTRESRINQTEEFLSCFRNVSSSHIFVSRVPDQHSGTPRNRLLIGAQSDSRGCLIVGQFREQECIKLSFHNGGQPPTEKGEQGATTTSRDGPWDKWTGDRLTYHKNIFQVKGQFSSTCLSVARLKQLANVTSSEEIEAWYTTGRRQTNQTLQSTGLTEGELGRSSFKKNKTDRGLSAISDNPIIVSLQENILRSLEWRTNRKLVFFTHYTGISRTFREDDNNMLDVSMEQFFTSGGVTPRMAKFGQQLELLQHDRMRNCVAIRVELKRTPIGDVLPRETDACEDTQRATQINGRITTNDVMGTQSTAVGVLKDKQHLLQRKSFPVGKARELTNDNIRDMLSFTDVSVIHALLAIWVQVEHKCLAVAKTANCPGMESSLLKFRRTSKRPPTILLKLCESALE